MSSILKNSGIFAIFVEISRAETEKPSLAVKHGTITMYKMLIKSDVLSHVRKITFLLGVVITFGLLCEMLEINGK